MTLGTLDLRPAVDHPALLAPPVATAIDSLSHELAGGAFVAPIDPTLADIIVGSGVRRSKIALPGVSLASLPGAQVVEGLARAID